MINTEGGTDDEEFRVAAVVDRVNTTMQVWMGTTFACAQCHDHKYDPFTQKEYFQLFAFFNNTADGGRKHRTELPLPTAEQVAKQDEIRAELARWKAQLDQATKAARRRHRREGIQAEADPGEDRRVEEAERRPSSRRRRW